MAGQIRVNTSQVAQIATSIENLNKRLDAELKDSQANVKSLSSTWEGEASNATISAFDSFAAKYFQTYYDVIDSYVKFLRRNVDSGYFETETAVTNLSGEFN
ncbi:MAG: WXG100 family type VII secretion target [Oscillospiraceae bacterium]|jgi:WXG100 family type VII secretion target|nr:WXG100 family type VII secretion target [Oscillospiraceae bacterium]